MDHAADFARTDLKVSVKENLMTTEGQPCGLDIAIAVMGGKWKPLILYHLDSGPKRFGDLKRLVVGVSEKVLIQQLRELAAAGVLTRHDYQRVPPMVDYTITEFGLTLAQALMPLCIWGTVNRDQITALGLSSLADRAKFTAILPNERRSKAA